MSKVFHPWMFAVCIAMAVQTPAHAGTDWTLRASSRLGFAVTQAGQVVHGAFEKFSAAITFSADDLANAKILIIIDMASVNTESTDRDSAIRSAGLFDVATWPTARFSADRFRRLDDRRYEARGQLTIRDQTRDVRLPFTLDVMAGDGGDGIVAEMRGTLAVRRLDYGVGQGVWRDTTIVGDAIEIIIAVTATAEDADWRRRLSEE
jgi:polyisoprenoid-binding protein YceI